MFKKKPDIKKVGYSTDGYFDVSIWKGYKNYAKTKHRVIIRPTQFSPNITANILWVNISSIGNFPLVFESRKVLLDFKDTMAGRNDWDIDWDSYMNAPNTSVKNVKEYKTYFYDIYFISKTKVSFIDKVKIWLKHKQKAG